MEFPSSRVTFVTTSALAALAAATWVLWDQDLRYRLPTPVPAGYRAPPLHEGLALPAGFPHPQGAPVLIHFFNPECPCSRFGLDHLKELELTFSGQLHIVAVVAEPDAVPAAQDQFRRHGLTLPVWTDHTGELATRSGVYSTPQAILLDGSSRLFFRGNYNSSRYCRDRETEFARLAIEALLQGRSLPPLPQEATRAWGCPRVPSRSNSRSVEPRLAGAS